MAFAQADQVISELPEGYAAVPVSAGQLAAPLRICVLFRSEPDPAGGRLLVLRDTADARVLLGCVADAGGNVRRWVELWVQSLEGLDAAPSAWQEALSNAVLDQRWGRHFAAFARLEQNQIIQTGWEQTHPLPTFVDAERLSPVHPAEASSGKQWRLCQDDRLLVARGLPAYGVSLHRYLYVPELGQDSPFVAVTQGAPRPEGTRALGDLAGGGLVPLNPGGGLMMVQAHSPIGLAAYVDLLGGGPWEGLWHGRTAVLAGAMSRRLRGTGPAGTAGGRLFLENHGRWGRLIETFHLKLALLADVVSAVRTVIREHRLPLLNLSEEGLQVSLAQAVSHLPFLWTGRAVLADPGDAIALPIATSDVQYFARTGRSAPSIYRPVLAGGPARGRGTVRIREVLSEAGEATVLEGTFVCQERIESARNDLVWLRLAVADRRVDLYARLVKEAALAEGEWRFRTVGQRLGADAQAALRAAAGVPLPNVAFEIVPLISSPCDLYAVGVLAVRTLVVNAQTTLPVALDEMLSLAKQVAVEHDETQPLGERIGAIFEQDARWPASLGPQRLSGEEMTPQEAFEVVPPRLWWDALAMAVRMFPGMGPDSTCADFGDAPRGRADMVFERAQRDLEALLLRTRSLIVMDRRSSREISAVIARHAGGPA